MSKFLNSTTRCQYLLLQKYFTTKIVFFLENEDKMKTK